MSVKEMLTKLNNFSDNPYDAKYRPEKEMKILYAALLISLPILLGLCNGFFILAFGPLTIYWVVTYFRAKEYWKAFGWKMWKFHLPALGVGILGFVLAFTGALMKGIGWLFGNLIFYK